MCLFVTTYECTLLFHTTNKFITQDIPSAATFYVYFAKHFAKVKFPKCTCLAVCDLCMKLHTNKLLATTEQDKRVIRRLMRDHTTLHHAERESYAVHKKDAQRCPEQS